jgi:uncharacterized Tic20 family protein
VSSDHITDHSDRLSARPRPEPDEDHPVQYGVPSEDRTMAILCHIGGYFTSFVVPVVLYLSAKGRSSFTDHHNREALNLQISFLIYYFLVMLVDVAVLVTAGLAFDWQWAAIVSGSAFAFFTLVFGIWETICIIVACVAAYRGRLIRFPLCVRLV